MMLPLGDHYVGDALSLLHEWIGDASEIRRTMRLDDSEHAALSERVKVISDALQLRPDIRRLNGHTQIRLRPADGHAFGTGEVTLAARIDDAYRAVTGTA